MKRNPEGLEKLINIMDKLLSPEGCPWDRQQNHESIKPYLIEETYEVLEAIDSGDKEMFKEELGDLLLQVIFHSAIAKNNGDFNINDVIDAICEKLIRRHPHVFADVKVKDSNEVLKNWEQIKKNEKTGEKKRKSVLEGVPKELPALLRAHRIQEKASRVGFDWDHVSKAMEKVDEELAEFKQACESESPERIEEELGDLFFSIVNISRFIETNPEIALQKTIAKFIHRFTFIEHKLSQQHKDLGKVPLEELDKLWDESKKEK